MTDYSIQLFSLGPFFSLSPYTTSLNVPVLFWRVEALSEFHIKPHLWVRDLHPILEAELTQTTQIIETIGPNPTVPIWEREMNTKMG